MACILCHGSGLLWSSQLYDLCPLCGGDPKWDMTDDVGGSVVRLVSPVEGAAQQVSLQDVKRLCSVGTAGETVQRQQKALGGGGAKSARAKHARETMDILAAGHYVSSGGLQVDVSTSLCDAVAASTHFSEATWQIPARSAVQYKLGLEVRCCTVLAAAQDLATSSTCVPGVLNFASARNPGGGFLTGAEAQEESLARNSGLYPCLSKHFKAFFAPSRRAASGVYTHDLIHSPKVPVIRDEKGVLLDEPYFVDFVTAAAPNCGVLRNRSSEQKAAAQCRDTLHERSRRVLYTFASNGCTDIVLGAWGCGVFGNDPAIVAQLFGDALAELLCFRRVIFAVLDPRMAQIFGEQLELPVEGLPTNITASCAFPQDRQYKKGKAETKPISRKERRRLKGVHDDD